MGLVSVKSKDPSPTIQYIRSQHMGMTQAWTHILFWKERNLLHSSTRGSSTLKTTGSLRHRSYGTAKDRTS